MVLMMPEEVIYNICISSTFENSFSFFFVNKRKKKKKSEGRQRKIPHGFFALSEYNMFFTSEMISS